MDIDGSSDVEGIEVLLEGLLGFECCVDFVWYYSSNHIE
jgi:hypothetical protein